MRILLLLIFTACLSPASAGEKLDPSVKQLILGVTPGWNSQKGVLRCYERHGNEWKPAVFSAKIPMLVGRSGLAWGNGVMGQNQSGLHKKEGDGRAPAGTYKVGTVYGYAPTLPAGSHYPYRKVSKWDSWSDDPKSPRYNRHVVVDPSKGVPAWFQKEKMRHGDFAYAWLVEIRHNSDPPIPGKGSAIFFHIRRGADRPTAGCTTMEKKNLEAILRWLRKDKNPQYVLLPGAEYEKRMALMGLPDIRK